MSTRGEYSEEYSEGQEASYEYMDYYEFQPSRAQADCLAGREAWLAGDQPLLGTTCPPHWDRSATHCSCSVYCTVVPTNYLPTYNQFLIYEVPVLPS